jgi:hypothetical protein
VRPLRKPSGRKLSGRWFARLTLTGLLIAIGSAALPGFEATLAFGVTTLEMDLVVTRDGVVVVHHDRRLDPARTRAPDGAWLAEPTPGHDRGRPGPIAGISPLDRIGKPAGPYSRIYNLG